MFTGALFVLMRSRKQMKCLMMNPDKYLSYIHSVIKNNNREVQWLTWKDDHSVLSGKAG